jgi:cytochrome c553
MGKKSIGLGVIATAVSLSCLLASCSPETASSTSLTDAAQIYANDCASCHAADRTGDRGPNIKASALTEITESSLAAFLTDHKTAKNLTPAQRSIMAAWLKK